MPSENSAQIAKLNNDFRKNLLTGRYGLGRFFLTPGIQALPYTERVELVRKVHDYADWSHGNDPYGEHDFGVVEVGGQRVYWKIDYYNADLTQGSDDPSDPVQTTRVLTIMLAEEY